MTMEIQVRENDRLWKTNSRLLDPFVLPTVFLFLDGNVAAAVYTAPETEEAAAVQSLSRSTARDGKENRFLPLMIRGNRGPFLCCCQVC